MDRLAIGPQAGNPAPRFRFVSVELMRLLFALICGGAVLGQTGDKTGPAVGAKVPDFETTDQNGVRQSLASLMGPKGMMLVFFRSADW